ncbi:dirigent protein 21 [Sesamum indicum]|uniref:Dirigent protein n=1 Tax=Sesamum indicum TaxID=4182 RepID=A0A6I9TXJ1_SESIN|nr:dirigent protein 21 [Sesamum indicum]
MANIIIFIVISSLSIACIPSGYARKQGPVDNEKAWFQNICQGNEKVAKLQFYVQDVLSGENTTVYEIARASITSNSPTAFGQVRVLDDLLTAEPDINSEVVGRVQGLITSADLETSALAINLNFVFTSGQYSGSTISILGRNQIMNKERELPVVGGTGVFRFARGYAITSTHSYNVETSYGILEYTIYVTYVDDSSMRLQANM